MKAFPLNKTLRLQVRIEAFVSELVNDSTSGGADSKRSLGPCLPRNSHYFEENIRDQMG